MLESLGYSEAPERSMADLILFNTCSIRESADSRFIAHLGEAKRLKSERPERIIGVGGCWAQSVKEEVFERFPFVDVAFGPGQVHKLAEFLTSDSLSAQGYFEFEGFTGHLPARRERPFQGWLQISVGCNCACSYCIVPSTRGREVSRPLESSSPRSQAMAADGVREVTLLGQNVNSYGRDLRSAGHDAGARSRELLAAVDGIEGIERDPLHEPAPEGHARGRDPRSRRARERLRAHPPAAAVRLLTILKAMRRTYDRRALPGPRRADPRARPRRGAHDRHHRRLSRRDRGGLRARRSKSSEQVGYDSAFTFVFSPRRGTEAAKLTEGLVPHPVKVERMERLVEVVQRQRARARPALRRSHAGGARRRPLAHRPRAPARAHPPQQGRQLHRPRRARRAD